MIINIFIKLMYLNIIKKIHFKIKYFEFILLNYLFLMYYLYFLYFILFLSILIELYKIKLLT